MANKPKLVVVSKTDTAAIPQAILDLRTDANAALTALRKAEIAGNSAVQAYALVAMRHHEACTASGVVTVGPWSTMRGNDHKPSKAFDDWFALVKVHFNLTAPTKPEHMNADAETEQRAHTALMARVRDACRLAVAVGASGGTSKAWNAKERCLAVNSDLFKPDAGKGKAWSYRYRSGAFDTLINLSVVTFERAKDNKGNMERHDVRVSAASTLSAYWRTATPKKAGSDATKGADDKTPPVTAAERDKLLKSATFNQLMIAAAYWLKPMKGCEPVTPAMVKGDTQAWNACQAILMMLTKDATIAPATPKPVAPSKPLVTTLPGLSVPTKAEPLVAKSA